MWWSLSGSRSWGNMAVEDAGYDLERAVFARGVVDGDPHRAAAEAARQGGSTRCRCANSCPCRYAAACRTSGRGSSPRDRPTGPTPPSAPWDGRAARETGGCGAKAVSVADCALRPESTRPGAGPARPSRPLRLQRRDFVRCEEAGNGGITRLLVLTDLFRGHGSYGHPRIVAASIPGRRRGVPHDETGSIEA